MSLVSVVTTFYNAGERVLDAIASMQNQTYENFEHILVDDGSTDFMGERICEVEDKRVVLVKPGRVGRARALNFGLEQAKGEYIAILDADDTSLAERLFCQKRMLDADQGLALVCSNAVLFDDDENFRGVSDFPVEHDELVESLKNMNPFPHSSVMYRSEFAKRVSGYNIRCEKSIDFNFYLSLLEIGGKFKGNKQPLINVHGYNTSSWGKSDGRGLQARYVIIGLVNHYAKGKGEVGMLDASASDWNRIKTVFDEWFEKNKFVQQVEAKKHFLRARNAFRGGRLISAIKGIWGAGVLDPWFWTYRGFDFRYSVDAEHFLEYLKNHSTCENLIMSPLVSIIIPTHNRANDLKRALGSVFEQTFIDFEVLVMDDGSTDNTCEVIKNFNDARIIYEWAENFGGPAAPRNRGLRLARGKYVAFLDSDDWWMPKKLEESIKYLNQGADVVYHNLSWVTKLDQKLFWKKTCARSLKIPVFSDLLKHGNALPNSSVVVRKELLNAINGQSEDTNLVGVEDYEAWLRIAKVSDKFLKIPKTLGSYWAGGGNLSNPDRVLKYVTALEKLYVDTIPDLDDRCSIFWLNYTKGRTYFCLKDYAMAKKYLNLNRWSRTPLMFSIKTCWMLFMINLCHRSKISF
jgi:glycosyltransferase involved in cell wall biosynthesis